MSLSKTIGNFFPIFSFFVLLLWSCQEARESATPTGPAQEAVDAALAAHGSGKLRQGRVAFDFRDRHYVADRDGGKFTYERIFTDSTGRRVRDILDNDGLRREVDGRKVELSSKDSVAYSNSVNSVLYFALLPLFLNDAAVEKEYLGEEVIGGEPYEKVLVTFRQDGGGKDHEDEYVYWFHRERHTMDYFAYNYLVDGGGARFREAYNVREIQGIRFADYVNYQPRDSSREVRQFGQMFENGAMEELSRIESENITFRANEN